MDIVREVMDLKRKVCCLLKLEGQSFVLTIMSIGDDLSPNLALHNTIQVNNAGSVWVVDSFGNSQLIETAGGGGGGSETFQQVTTNGDTTTQNFFLIDDASNNVIEFLNSLGAGQLNLNDWTSSASLQLIPGEIVLQNFVGFSNTLRTDNSTDDRVNQMPDDDGVLPTNVNGFYANSTGRITLPPNAGVSNGIVDGGIVTWQGNYDYNISPAIYNINGVTYTSPSTDVTLSPADVTDDRIDLFILDSSNTASVLTGVPSPTPAPPTADPTTQLPIEIVLVSSNTTEPLIPVPHEYIFRENAGTPTEWTGTPSSVTRFKTNSVTGPLVGTISIEALVAQNGDNIVFVPTTPPETILPTYNILTFKIKSKIAWTPDKGVTFKFNLAPGPGSPIITLKHGTYGFDSSDITTVQTISIALNSFSIASVDSLTIAISTTTGGFGFWIDDIQMQKSIVPFIGNFWYAIGDNIFNNNPGSVNFNNGITMAASGNIRGNNTILYTSGSGLTQHDFANPGSPLGANVAMARFRSGGSTSGSYSKIIEAIGDVSTAAFNIYALGNAAFGPATTPSKLAQIDINSVGRGLLIPRLTTAQRDGIPQYVATIPVSAGGAGYALAPVLTVAVSPVGGLRARARAVVAGGTVTSIVIEFVGSGYPTPVSVAINNVGTGGYIGAVPQPDGSGLVLGTMTVAVDTIPEGLLIYNNSKQLFEYYDGNEWFSWGGSSINETVILGTLAGGNNTGSVCVIIGSFAGQSNSGTGVTIVGAEAGIGNRGESLVAIGYTAGSGNTGDSNTLIGTGAGSSCTGGSVTAIGFDAAFANEGNGVVIIGAGAGINNVFSNVIIIGAGVGAVAIDENQVVLAPSDKSLTLDFSNLTDNRVQSISDSDGNLFVGYKDSYNDSSAVGVTSVTITLPTPVLNTRYQVIITSKTSVTVLGHPYTLEGNKSTTQFIVSFPGAGVTGILQFDWTILL